MKIERNVLALLLFVAIGFFAIGYLEGQHDSYKHVQSFEHIVE